ncbi:hypothetical protein BV898_00921 [Hypsibius exemplaris]|uniref:PIN domain-containing protein n=1 Tax=Hypsibius exemplaris TaxID=2072580 RepID=A0A1W0XCM6_HYPEX|nr:hypothetical protein BV898_00921 [Hypsibius exemplaris]
MSFLSMKLIVLVMASSVASSKRNFRTLNRSAKDQEASLSFLIHLPIGILKQGEDQFSIAVERHLVQYLQGLCSSSVLLYPLLLELKCLELFTEAVAFAVELALGHRRAPAETILFKVVVVVVVLEEVDQLLLIHPNVIVNGVSNRITDPASATANTNSSVNAVGGGNSAPAFGGNFSQQQQSQPGHQQQEQPRGTLQQVDHQQNQQQQQRHNQPSRQLYRPRGGNNDKNRGPGGGGGGNYEQNQPLHGQNRDPRDRDNNSGGRQSGGPSHVKGQSAPRENARPQQKRPQATSSSGAPGIIQEQQQQSLPPIRNYDPVSSRETSSIDTQDNDDALHGSRNMMGDSDRENRENQNHHFSAPKTMPFGSGQIQNQQQLPVQGNQGGRRDQKRGVDGGQKGQEAGQYQKQSRADQQPPPHQQQQQQQNRHQQMKVLQNTFNEPFSKSIDSDLERENDNLSGGGFGQFKNGAVGILSHGGHGGFDEPMNMYGQSKQARYFPAMGDIGHQDKAMNDRAFQSAPHDGGDIFSAKDVFWRGTEREEKRDMYMRDEPSPVIGKSMIWSNQGSTTPITHSQPESPHFNRPLMSGPFGMDPGAFAANAFINSPSSMMDPQMVDPVGHHQRMMHQNIPMNQAFQGLNMTQMNERIHPVDRMGQTLFNQQMMGIGVGGGGAPQMRMGFHPQQHNQYSDGFMGVGVSGGVGGGRDQGRLQQQQQQQQHQAQHMQSGGFVPPNQLQNVGGLPVSRSPQTAVAQDKWGGGSWDEHAVEPVPEVPAPPPKAPEPVEDFGEFKVPVLKGAKNFDNLCVQGEEIRQAIQAALKEFVDKPHHERLRRVLFLQFAYWNVVRDAVLLDNVQSCAKDRELDQKVWREGFYPIYSVLRGLSGKTSGKSETVAIDDTIRGLLGRALKFYNDLIPRVLHPFGGSVTAQTAVNALSTKGRMADHILVTLQLADRLHTHQGDVYRYLAELPGSDGTELNQAKEMYRKACILSPYNGQPHSQLVLVAKRQNRPLEIAFHAIRALSTKLPYPDALYHLNSLWPVVEKTFESKKWAEEKATAWNEIPSNELNKRFHLTFLAIHGSLYGGKYVTAILTVQGTQFLNLLEAMLNHPLALSFRDVLLEMMAINIYRLSTLAADSQSYAFLMDLSFNMFDIVLARLLRIFDSAPDLDSAAHLEDTSTLSPVVKVFVEWIKTSYQKWFPLSPSLLSAPKDTKRTSMWSRLVSLVNLSLTLNVAGVSEERFPDSQGDKLHEDLLLAGMQSVHPAMQIFYRETRLHETIAEPRFRFKKLQPLGQVLLSVSPPVARLQWNRFIPTDAYFDKNVKHLWAPLEPPPSQPRMEPLPVMPDPRIQEQFMARTIAPAQPERPDTSSRWKSANPPVSEAVEQAWPSLGQSTKLLTDERRERARTASTNSGDDGGSRGTKNGDSASPHESSRSNVEPWWLMDKRLRSNDAGNQLKLNGPEPDRKIARQEVSSKQYFLVDTNVLIDYLDRLEKKVVESEDMVVLVPGTVYRELWKLHQGKNLKAHFALSFISDAMEHHKGRVMVITTKGESIPHAQLAKREVVIERGSNDDIILRTCLTLLEKGLVNPDEPQNRRPVEAGSWRGSLLLVTSDVNMRLKAKKENIFCGPVNEILSA